MTLEALEKMFSMCLCHVPVLLNVSPRCLWSFTNCFTVLLIEYQIRKISELFKGKKDGFCFKWIEMWDRWVRMRRIVARSVDKTIFLDFFLHFGLSHLTFYILSFFL